MFVVERKLLGKEWRGVMRRGEFLEGFVWKGFDRER